MYSSAATNSPATSSPRQTRRHGATQPSRLPAARQLAQPTPACSTVPPPPTARLPPPVSARRRAGLRSPPLRPHQLPLGGRATSPLFAVARPLPAPRCLASVCHPTASPPSRPRQLLLAGCTVGYRACPFAYPSSRSARLLRLLQPPCAPLLSCPARISKVSNTRDAPRDEGKREEAQRPRDKTHGDEGEDVHAAGLLITQEPVPARDIAILPSCPPPTMAATTLPGHMTSLRTFVPQGPRCRATRALRRRSEQRSEWWTGTNDSTSSTMDWPASLAFSASDPTILGLSYNFYPIKSNPISSKVNGCPYPI